MTALVRDIERRTARAWPAREVIDVGGWECRFAGGYTGRANSVNPYGPVTGRLDDNVLRCEALFRERQLRALFRITPLIDPPDLDAALGRRGYVLRSRTEVMTRRPAPVSEPGPDLELYETVPALWLELLSKWTGVPPEREPLHRAILETIEPPRAFALLRLGDRPVACGLAVREPPWTGLFDLVTDPGCRRRGHGTRLVEGLLAWGASGGGDGAYLQVVAENDPAIRLYRRLGFRHAYDYWYRVSTEESPYRLPKSPD